MLRGIIVKINELSETDVENMFCLMSAYYENIKREKFTSDLSRKSNAILLKDENGAIKGFSTLVFYEFSSTNLLFSGDTIIHHDFWTNNDLMSVWLNFAIQKASTLDAPLYWLLISKGYKTYKYLPLVYKEYYPKLGAKMPEFEQKLMDEFCTKFYPEQYTDGLLLNDGSNDYLKAEFAQIPENKLKDKHIKFFLEKNPNYANGDELVCLTLLSKENLTKIGRRILGA